MQWVQLSQGAGANGRQRAHCGAKGRGLWGVERATPKPLCASSSCAAAWPPQAMALQSHVRPLPQPPQGTLTIPFFPPEPSACLHPSRLKARRDPRFFSKQVHGSTLVPELTAAHIKLVHVFGELACHLLQKQVHGSTPIPRLTAAHVKPACILSKPAGQLL